MILSREESQRRLDIQATAASTHKPEQSYTLADRFEERATTTPDKTFLIYQNQHISYSDINRLANRVAGAARSLGLKQGGAAALMMDNRPEFFAVYLGLAKLGVTAALINTHAQDAALAHALLTTHSQLLFAGIECLEQVSSLAEPQRPCPVYAIPNALHAATAVDIAQSLAWVKDFIPLLDAASMDNPPIELRKDLQAQHDLFMVFTSGTTGLPKAAHMSHMRWLNTGESNAAVLQASADDVFYCFLPLYHGAAGMSLVSAALATGASILLRERFSTSRFLDEVRRHQVTICQYIGEICRYLLNAPVKADDADNPLKKIVGAGLNETVWQQFQQRFGIEQVFEGWGATESNCGMMNLDNKLGSCGRIPFKEKSNVRLIRYDAINDCHITDSEGYAIECEANESGELIGMILDIPGSGAGRFEGYTATEATEKKIMRNVFSQGDAWFRSGDLLRRDQDDYYFFVDRVGDTYRWKSENVSTMEVTNALADYPRLETINVYGVAVPEQEGRAGMATLVMDENQSFATEDFFHYCSERLPRYAMPLFVRISAQAEITTTFKLKKVDLQKQGYSLTLISDPLFVADDAQQRYIPLTDQSLARLNIKPFQD